MSDRQPPKNDGPQERLQEKILEDYPRLGPNDTFQFGCHPGVSCFNRMSVSTSLAP